MWMPESGRLLLDTNIVIALPEDDDAVLSNLDQAPEIFIPTIVVGELFFAAAKSGRPSENTAKRSRKINFTDWAQWCSSIAVVLCRA